MRKRFALPLAISGIRRNGKFYIPYFLACAGTSAMFYVMQAVSNDPGLLDLQGGASLRSMMAFGAFVVGLFSVIVIFYTNAFLMKRRQKEMGLYNLLGMDKTHIGRILALETVIIGLSSVGTGLLIGMLFGKLVKLLLGALTRFPAPVSAAPDGPAALFTLALFAVIFVLVLAVNQIRLGFTRPVELLAGEETGEREPKTRALPTLLGLLTLGLGYFIALTVQSPLKALTWFFIAVLLVIAGTYFLFTAGSVALLKRLRATRSYYYQARHFVSVSGMLHRMKRNAAGLATIAILSTMVLVTVSTTVAMYFGAEEQLASRYPADIQVSGTVASEKEGEALAEKTLTALSDLGRTTSNTLSYAYLPFPGSATERGIEALADLTDAFAPALSDVCVLRASAYAKLSGAPVVLSSGEALLGGTENAWKDFTLLGVPLKGAGRIDDFPLPGRISANLQDTCVCVLGDEDYARVEKALAAVYPDQTFNLNFFVRTDIDGTEDEKIAAGNRLSEQFDVYVECKDANRAEFHAMYGGFLFLGLFLGLLFLMATVLIIYYKQISEGYEDARRFRVMQNVGMGEAEVRSAIGSQMLTVFFLPLIAAVCHIFAAFTMIVKLLGLFSLTNTGLFLLCTVATIGAFSVIYVAVYALTARIYYRIVK